MKTHLTKEEVAERMKSVAIAFEKAAFKAQDVRLAAQAIAKAFQKQTRELTIKQ